jgi:poly(A) polymerase
MRFKDVQNMKESTLKRFFRTEHFDEHLELHRLDCAGSHRMLDNYDFAVAKLAEFGAEQIRPPRLIGGRDLMEAGFEPGPELGRILGVVEDAQLEGRIHTREEAIELARSLKNG